MTIETTKKRKNLDGNIIEGIVIGILMELVDDVPKVIFPGNTKDAAIAALTTVEISSKDIGREFALSFQNGNPDRPIILGKLFRPDSKTSKIRDTSMEVDGKPEDIEFTGKNQVVLRCGKASITLTRAGKIILKGAYISSHSTGANRIKGGSVQLN